MLETLRGGLGFRIAVSLALFAALCFVAPPAVMAFGHGENTVHCLAQADVPDHGMAHAKPGAGQQHHGDHARLPTDKAPSCCGLFCLSALMPSSAPVFAASEPHETLAPQRGPNFAGRIRDLLYRPPISDLSV